MSSVSTLDAVGSFLNLGRKSKTTVFLPSASSASLKPFPSSSSSSSTPSSKSHSDLIDHDADPTSLNDDADFAASLSPAGAVDLFSSSSSLPVGVANFRSAARVSHIPTSYDGYRHFLQITVFQLSALFLSFLLSNFSLHPLTFILTFLFSNVLEYALHRTRMHDLHAHTRHAMLHHRFYTAKAMEYENWNDLITILFPAEASWFLLTMIMPIPVGSLWLLFGRRVAFTWSFTASFYYLSYEYLHLAYHSPEDSWLSRIPGMKYLRRHHQIHHHQPLMNKYNFNITYPIMDFVLGTTYKGPRVWEKSNLKE